MTEQIITIKFTLLDDDMPGFEKIPVQERAQNIGQFVADELIGCGTYTKYEVIEVEEHEYYKTDL